jgi:3-hydroxyacyl-[acyl-carrier-protein] dehydratase
MDSQNLIRQYRKKPITTLWELAQKKTFTKLNYNQETIKKIIPHREPFLFVDKLIGLDLTKDKELIVGLRKISEKDPVFQGHFPDLPVYPGSLQLEMAGQVGLCLTYFVLNSRNSIADDAKPLNVLATRILGASFMEPVYPGKEVTLIAKRLEHNDFFGAVLSQIISDQKVCCISISEVMFINGSPEGSK